MALVNGFSPDKGLEGFVQTSGWVGIFWVLSEAKELAYKKE